jgi:hypothetical protein
MRSIKNSIWKYIFHVAEKAFVEGAFTPSPTLVKMTSVPFAIPTEVAKQKRRKSRKY